MAQSACYILDSNGAARRAALVSSLNYLPVVTTIQTDHLKDNFTRMSLIVSEIVCEMSRYNEILKQHGDANDEVYIV